MIRNFLAFSLIVFSGITFSGLVHSNSFVVQDIQLEGLQRVSASPVFAALPVRTGQEIDAGDVRDIIQAMLATGFFNNVQVARDGNILLIILEERPAIKSLELEGNKKLKSEQLYDVMEDNGLAEGEIFQRHTLQGLSQSVENQYISQARYDANVTAEVEELPNNLVKVLIKIDEGSAASIRHYNITGNTVFSDKELQEVLELGVAKWYQPFSSKNKYAKEKLSGDIESLESFYLDQGYLDFKVLSSQVSISPDRKSVYIVLNVNEGDVYTTSAVDLAGDPILSEDRVRRLFLVREDETFSQAAMTRSTEYITTLLGNSGYTNAKVEGITEKNEEENTVKVTFFIDPGKRTYVRRINFNGHTKTTDEVLRREMRQMESASASNSKIEQSKIRLNRLGFFKEVNVETVDVPGFSDLVDVNYDVEEQPSGSISASVGYADQSGFNFGINVSESNWLGSGVNVGLGVTKNRFQENYTFSFTDPYFTPEGVSRGISVYHRKTDFDEVSFSGSYSTDSTGTTVTFGYPISEISFLRFGIGYNFQAVSTGFTAAQQIQFSPFISDGSALSYVSQSDYENSRSLLSASPLTEFQLDTMRITEDMLRSADDVGFIDKYGSEFHNAIANITWSRRTLNRGVLATRGNSQSLSFEAAIPGSDLQYYKLTYDGQMFQPLTRDLTLRFKTRVGYGQGYGDMDELPFFENFRAGGFGSVRGYKRYTLGPKIVPANRYFTTPVGVEDIAGDGVINGNDLAALGSAFVLCEDPTSLGLILRDGSRLDCEPGKLLVSSGGVSRSSSSSFGGNFLVEFSTELILPIPFVKDSRTMQLVAFVDAGNVFTENCLENQLNCDEIGSGDLSSSYGIGFKWLSAMGPLTFSFAKPIKQNDLDQRKFFDFTFGTGF